MKALKRNYTKYSFVEAKLVMLLNNSFDSRRNQLQILSDILEFCKMPQPKTRILHMTNTNFKQLERYLLQLQVSGLVEKSLGMEFSTTSKGAEFLETWATLQIMLMPEQESATVKTRKKCINGKQLLFLAAYQSRQ